MKTECILDDDDADDDSSAHVGAGSAAPSGNDGALSPLDTDADADGIAAASDARASAPLLSSSSAPTEPIAPLRIRVSSDGVFVISPASSG